MKTILHARLLATMAALTVLGTPRAADVPLDAVSGASGGRKMMTISKVSVTTTTAAITFSEGYRNGSLRLYYSTTTFASAADTTRSTVTKMDVATRGSGTVTLNGLTSDKKYYYRFQGYYPKGVANYWATGSFSTEAPATVRPGASSSSGGHSGFQAVDALGRRGPGSLVTHTPDGSGLRPRDDRR